MKEDDFHNKVKNKDKIQKLDYFKWWDFGFKKVDDKNKDGIYEIKEIIEDLEVAKLIDLNTFHTGNVWKVVKKEKVHDYLYKLVLTHPSEWKKKIIIFIKLCKMHPSI